MALKKRPKSKLWSLSILLFHPVDPLEQEDQMNEPADKAGDREKDHHQTFGSELFVQHLADEQTTDDQTHKFDAHRGKNKITIRLHFLNPRAPG